jgi:hypothetical protein
VRLGGLSIEDPSKSSADKYSNSLKATALLKTAIIEQLSSMSPDIGQSKQIKMEIKKSIVESQKKEMEAIYQKLNIEMQRAVLVAQEKSASVFLTALPLKRHNFDLSKTEFTDTLLMRYRWPLPNLPSICPCGEQFSLDHSQICHTGGFINMRHIEVRDLIAHEMKEILKDVESEPHLTPLTGEAIHMRSANVENDARSDIRARGFWAKQQNAFFDVSGFFTHMHEAIRPGVFRAFLLHLSKKRNVPTLTESTRWNMAPSLHWFSHAVEVWDRKQPKL